MKTSFCLASLPALLCLHGALAQAPVPPPPPLPPPPPVVDEDVVIERSPKRVRAGQAGLEVTAPGGGASISFREVSGSTKPSRSLVVQFNPTDTQALARAEEDLAIMARILDKAARSRREDEPAASSFRPMGINVDSSIFGSSSGARNIYIENQGALFLLSVKYPLLAPEKPSEAKAKDNTSDEWKQAQAEVAGGGSDGVQFFEYAIAGGAAGMPEEFDADKVKELKDALTSSLKNATHLRMVKPDEFITVVVQGADASGTVTKVARDPKGNTRVATTARASTTATRRNESVLTLRVKKSDADAFAAGKLDLDAFRKKVATQTYLRRPFASAVPDMFNLPVVR